MNLELENKKNQNCRYFSILIVLKDNPGTSSRSFIWNLLKMEGPGPVLNYGTKNLRVGSSISSGSHTHCPLRNTASSLHLLILRVFLFLYVFYLKICLTTISKKWENNLWTFSFALSMFLQAHLPLRFSFIHLISMYLFPTM